MFLDIVSRLIDEKLVAVTHLVAFPHLTSKYKNFENVCVLDKNHFTLPDHIFRLNDNTNLCLSESLIKEFTACENMFLSISDRCSFCLSVWERKRIYYELLRYWYNFFKSNSIKVVVFNTVPHAGWSYVVYGLAKKLNIRTLYRQGTYINDRILLLEDYVRVEKVPYHYLAKLIRNEIISQIDNSLYEEVKKPSTAESLDRNFIKKVIRVGSLFSLALSFPLRLGFGGIKMLKRKFNTSKVGSHFLPRNRIFAFNDRQNELNIEFIRYIYAWRLLRLRTYYSKIISKVNYNSKYVFFALHQQPEMTTCPMGGPFQEQTLAIRILAGSVPDDWIIYVKEHPGQFSMGMFSKLARDKQFYHQLRALKNVRLVGIQEDSIKLMKNSMFTATINGSVGWQSLMNEKACIVFGAPWYAGCNSCFIVKSKEDCEKAIKNIMSKTGEEIELDLLKFLAYYQDRFVVSNLSVKVARHSAINYDELVNNEVTALANRINSTEKTLRQDHFIPCSTS